MRTIISVMTIAAVIFVGWNILAPAQFTIFPVLGQKLGALESNWLIARTPAAEAQAQALAQAEAEVERLTVLNQRAVELEAQIAQRQITSTSNSHWVKNFGANVSDFMCGVGVLGQFSNTENSEKFLEFCAVADDLRRSMAQDYGQALNGARSTVMQDMNRAFGEAQAVQQDRGGE